MSKQNLTFIINTDARQFHQTINEIKSATKKAGSELGKLAGIGSVGGFITGTYAFAKSVIEAADNVAELAERSGMSIRAVQELSYVGKQSGVSFETFANSIKIMQKQLGATAPTEKFKAALASVGLAIENMRGLSPEDAFKKMMGALSEIEDPTRKAALAMELFGKQGTLLVPAMEDGATGIQTLIDKAHEMGVVMTDENVIAADKFNHSIETLNGSIYALAANTGVIAYLQSITDEMQALISNGERLKTIGAKGSSSYGSQGTLKAFANNVWESPLMKASPLRFLGAGEESEGNKINTYYTPDEQKKIAEHGKNFKETGLRTTRKISLIDKAGEEKTKVETDIQGFQRGLDQLQNSPLGSESESERKQEIEGYRIRIDKEKKKLEEINKRLLLMGDEEQKKLKAEQVLADQKKKVNDEILKIEKKSAEEQAKIQEEIAKLQEDARRDKAEAASDAKVEGWKEKIDKLKSKLDGIKDKLGDFGVTDLSQGIIKNKSQISQKQQDDVLARKIEASNSGKNISYSPAEKKRLAELEKERQAGLGIEGDIKGTEGKITAEEKKKRAADIAAKSAERNKDLLSMQAKLGVSKAAAEQISNAKLANVDVVAGLAAIKDLLAGRLPGTA